MKNHYIRLAEIVQEGLTPDLAEMFRDPERKLNLDETLPRLAEVRAAHQNRAAELWRRDGRVSEDLKRESALADLCAFFAACMTGGATEFRETAEEAMEILGYPGEKDMVRLLARRSP